MSRGQRQFAQLSGAFNAQRPMLFLQSLLDTATLLMLALTAGAVLVPKAAKMTFLTDVTMQSSYKPSWEKDSNANSR